MVQPSDNRLGIAAMLAAMTLFVVNDAFIKLVSAQYPPSQLMVIRGVFATVIALALVIGAGHGARLREGLSRPILTRAFIEAANVYVFVLCLAHLPLANVTAIVQATPIIMTLIAVVLGLEKVGWRRWAAVAVGFAGVLLIVRPTATGFSGYSVLALVTALLVACRDLLTRTIPAAAPSVVVTLVSTVAVTLLGAGLAGLEEWRPLAAREMTVLLAAAALVTAGNLCVVVAFRRAEVSVVSPFRYSIVLLAVVLGYVLFGDVPDTASWAGMTLIVASGIYTIHREHVRRREALRAMAPAAAR